MNPDNNARFRAVVSAVLGVATEQVADNLSPDRVDTWDSLNQINLISALEQEFGVTLPTEALSSYQSISGLRALLVERGVDL